MMFKNVFTAEPWKEKDFVFSQRVLIILKRRVMCLLTPCVWFRFQSYLKFYDFTVHYVYKSFYDPISLLINLNVLAGVWV